MFSEGEKRVRRNEVCLEDGTGISQQKGRLTRTCGRDIAWLHVVGLQRLDEEGRLGPGCSKEQSRGSEYGRDIR